MLAVAVATVMLPAPARAEPTTAELDQRLRTASRNLETVVEQFNDLREKLRSTQDQSRALGGRIAPLEAELRLRSEQMGRLAASTYRHGSTSSAVALLTGGTPRHLAGQLLVLDRLNHQRQRAAADLRHAGDRVAMARRTLAALADQQQDQQHRLALRKARIEQEIKRLQALRDRALAVGVRLATRHEPDIRPPRYLAGAAGRAVAFAFAQLGKPYRWGADGPSAYDCSGLTSAAWGRAGVRLPHSSHSQWSTVSRIDRADLRPGDLIFYYGSVSHVAMYIGGGRMIHAPQYGEPVRVDQVGYQPVHGYGRPR